MRSILSTLIIKMPWFAANQGVLDGQLGRIANVKDDYPIY